MKKLLRPVYSAKSNIDEARNKETQQTRINELKDKIENAYIQGGLDEELYFCLCDYLDTTTAI